MKNNERLKRYTAISGSILAASTGVNAQIIYTDVNPDTTIIQTNVYALNLDGDANIDFNLFAYNYIASTTNYDFVFIAPSSGNSVIATSNIYSGVYFPLALNLNDPIDNYAIFASPSASASFPGMFLQFNIVYSSSSSLPLGNWGGQTDKYLGLKFLIGGNTHYGWARMDVAADAKSFVLKDYAYNATPNTGLLAGQTVGIENFDQINSHISLSNNQLSVFYNSKDGELLLNIYNISGKLVSTKLITTSLEEKLNLPTGIYLFNVNTKNGSTSKKFYVY